MVEPKMSLSGPCQSLYPGAMRCSESFIWVGAMDAGRATLVIAYSRRSTFWTFFSVKPSGLRYLDRFCNRAGSPGHRSHYYLEIIGRYMWRACACWGELRVGDCQSYFHTSQPKMP